MYAKNNTLKCLIKTSDKHYISRVRSEKFCIGKQQQKKNKKEKRNIQTLYQILGK